MARDCKNKRPKTDRDWLIEKITDIFDKPAAPIGETRNGKPIGAWLVRWNLDYFSPCRL